MKPIITKRVLSITLGVFAIGFLAMLWAAERSGPTYATAEAMAVQSLPGIEFVEINTPSPGGQPKRLILFVHGTPGSLSSFLSYLNDPVLQQRYHMISVTRPGWINDDDDKEPSLDQQARALLPLLERNESAQGAILLGHSYGGPVIAKTAMEYPDLVDGLVFVATTGDPQLSGPRWYNRFAVVLPRLLLGDSLKGANAEIMPLRPQLEAMLPLWPTLEMPVLIVQGDKDRLVNPGNARFLQEVLVNAEVSLIEREGVGHFVLWEEREMIRDAMLGVFSVIPDIACDDSEAMPGLVSVSQSDLPDFC